MESIINKEFLIKFSHATKNVDVWVPAPMIFSMYTDQTLNATMLLSSGGALMPVKESVLDAADKLKQFYSTKGE